jgi:hypothetical protein
MACEIYFLLRSVYYQRLTCVQQENLSATLHFLITILCSFFRETVEKLFGGIGPMNFVS